MFKLFAPLALLFILAADSGCHNVKPDQFFEAVVDCAGVNPETSAVTASVVTCLVGATTGNPSACLTGLVTSAHWSIDEVACIVADIAQRENKKVQLDGDPKAIQVRNVAVDWLASERIAIRNSYPGR